MNLEKLSALTYDQKVNLFSKVIQKRDSFIAKGRQELKLMDSCADDVDLWLNHFNNQLRIIKIVHAYTDTLSALKKLILKENKELRNYD